MRTLLTLSVLSLLWAQIQFEKTEHDFGDVVEGPDAVYTFPFKNVGAKPTSLMSVKASCGCTAVEPTEKILKPGQSTEIVARFDSRGRTGVQHKTITVETNDPLNPRQILHLKANVIATQGFGIGGSAPLNAPSETY